MFPRTPAEEPSRARSAAGAAGASGILGTDGTARGWLGAAAREVVVVLFFLLLAAVATRPIVLDMGGRTLASGDPLVDLWTVDWLVQHFFSPALIFHGNLFHPTPHAVLFSDLSLGTVVLLLPLQGVDPVVLYNAALLAALAFAGWAFHALARELTGSRWAGLLAGVLAAFGSHQMSHVYHLNLLSIGWLALLLLALHRLARRPGAGAAVLAGVAFSLSAQSSGYYAVAGVILAIVFAAVHWRALIAPRALLAVAGSALAALLLTAPYLRAYMSVREGHGLRRPLGMSVSMAFQPSRDLTSHGYLYRGVLGSSGERLFPGLLTLVLAAVAIARRRPHAACYGIAAAVLVALSLGPRLEVGSLTVPLPYRWLLTVPPLDGMRHPYTFAAVATFALCVLAAVGWASLRTASRPWAGPAALAMAVAETLGPAPDTVEVPKGLPPYYEVLETLPPGPILELPVFSETALLWAARHGRPMVNGQGSAFVPVDVLRLDRFVQNHWIARTPVDVDASKPTPFLLQRFPVRYVVLPTGRLDGYRDLAAAFDRSRSFVPVGKARDGDRVYEVRRGASADPGEGGEEAGEVVGEDGEPVGDQQHSDADEQGARDVLHRPHVRAQPAEGGEEPVHRQSRGDEGESQAGGVRRQQHNPLSHRFLLRRVEQDGAQDRADAGRPSEGEGQAHDIGAQQAQRPSLHLRSLLVEQPLDPEDPGRVQAQDDDHDPADHP